jgi:hypothetical protein
MLNFFKYPIPVSLSASIGLVIIIGQVSENEMCRREKRVAQLTLTRLDDLGCLATQVREGSSRRGEEEPGSSSQNL